MKTFELSLAELKEWAKPLALSLRPQTLVILEGPLGAGKTFLTQQMISHLGGETATSPTYSLIQSHDLDGDLKAYHVDLYRLEDEEDLESIGFWDLLSEPQAILFLEWGDRLNPSLLPPDWRQVRIRISLIEKSEKRLYQIS